MLVSRESGSRHPRSTIGSRWLLALGITGAALAIGSVHTTTLCIVTAVLSLAVILGWWGAEPMNVRSAATLLLVAGIGLTAYTALQCVPMSAEWLKALAPYNADVWSRALSPLNEPGPKFAPLSLDPVATRVELLKGVTYLLTFVAALRVARGREGVGFLGATIVATGVALSVAALLHPAFGAHKLYGVYEPGPGIGDRHIAPLMNPNNLAGYINIAFCLALAETLAPTPRLPRAVTGCIALFLVATQLWVASRGGVLAMGVGAFVVIAITLLARSHRQHVAATISWTTGIAAAAGATLLVLNGSDEASNELLDANTDKLKEFAEVMRMAPRMPLFGCGRGAFASSFPAFRTMVGHVTFTYPENFVAQWLLEWGLPVGIAGLVAVAIALRPHAVLARSTTAAGAWAAVVAFGVQNLVDLGSEIPGAMIATVTCAALVVAGTRGHRARWRVERWALAPRSVAITAGIASVVAIALAVSGSLGVEVGEDQRALHDAAVVRPVSVSEMHSIARAAMLRHPAEPYVPFVVGLRAVHARDDNPLPWLGATLERAAVYGPAHLVLARIVAPHAPSQARLEYRLAIEQAPELISYAITEGLHLIGGFDDAMEMVPDGRKGIAVLQWLAALQDRLPATRERLDRELLARAPNDPSAASRIARDACDDLDANDDSPWCEGNGRAACVQDALAKSLRVEQIVPTQCVGFALHARARISGGDPNGAMDELERAADTVTDRVDCLQKLVILARSTHTEVRAQVALDRLVNSGCLDDAECAISLDWVASQQEAVGNVAKALSLAKRAHQRAPDNDAVAEHMASLASRAGLHAEAAADYEELSRRHPEDSRWMKAALDERQEILKGALSP